MCIFLIRMGVTPTPAVQEQADAKLAQIYRRMGAPECYRGVFYPGPHKFDLAMQGDAFDWFDTWLRRDRGPR